MIATIASRLACAGCGAAAVTAPGRYPFRCGNARAGDDIDHVVARVLDPASVEFPRAREANPFITYRTLFHAYHVARAAGMDDLQYVAFVRALDERIASVDGHGFVVTPFAPHGGLSSRIGGGRLWIKDETGNVSGSHKGRHLMGILIHVEVLAAMGDPAAHERPLAIASCGNAALAAAVLARAANRELRVFIPADAPRPIVERLESLSAMPILCPRSPGASGDPCFRAFENAVVAGAIPFCCQGSANGITIEGGETLGYEMIATAGPATLDAVVVQVGGGALASAVIQSFTDALALGGCSRLPRFYTVQTRGAFPLKRAYDRVLETAGGARAAGSEGRVTTAGAAGGGLAEALHYAATHRHEFMWPWEEEPRSIARGILDDETYDWLAVLKGMAQTGGRPVVVDESDLADAYTLARSTTGIDVDHTGAAGLAGLMRLVRDGDVAADEQVAVIFSGAERS